MLGITYQADSLPDTTLLLAVHMPDSVTLAHEWQFPPVRTGGINRPERVLGVRSQHTVARHFSFIY